MPLECDGKEILEFKGIYLQKAFASKIKRQIPYTKVTKFLPLNSRGNLCNSAAAYQMLSRVKSNTVCPMHVLEVPGLSLIQSAQVFLVL